METYNRKSESYELIKCNFDCCSRTKTIQIVETHIIIFNKTDTAHIRCEHQNFGLSG